MKKFGNTEVETTLSIYSTDVYHYEVGPDGDGLGCIEIRYYEDDNKEPIQRLMFSLDDAKALHHAIGKLITEMEEGDNK